MPNNNLILRTLISPCITPTPDITKSSVLKHIDVDNNFIYLRGELIYSATTVGNLVTLKKINGNDLSFNVGSGGGSDYWTSGSTGFYSIKTINDSGLDATGNYSVAKGFNTLASGNASHSGGVSSTASGLTSFIHSTNSLVTGDRSVVLGGQNITGATDDTVYVPNLNINNIGGTTSVTNLGIDSNGNVVSGTTGGTSSLWSTNVNGIHYNSGNVGIGMSASSVNTKLQIEYDDASPERAFRIKNTNDGSQYNFRSVLSGGENLLRFDSDNTGISPLVVSSANKVGIGTNSLVPQATLHVYSTSGSQPIVLVEDEANPDATPFIIDIDGNVVIGLSATTAKLHIDGTGGSVRFNVESDYLPDGRFGNHTLFESYDTPSGSTAINIVNNVSTGSEGIAIIALSDNRYSNLAIYGENSDTAIVASSNANDLNFVNSPGGSDNINFFAGEQYSVTPHLHVHGSGSTRGYVGVGTATPTEKLDVSGNTKISGKLSVGTNDNTYIGQFSGSTGRVMIDTDGNRLGDDRIRSEIYVKSLDSSGLTVFNAVSDNPSYGVGLGIVGSTPVAQLGQFGEANDAFLNAYGETNNFHIVNGESSIGDKEDSLLFYAGNTPLSTPTPTLTLYGSGSTKGNVGIGIRNPQEKLDVSGNTKISGTLNIGTLGTGTSVNNLGIDSSGNVVSGTSSSSIYWTSQTGALIDTNTTIAHTTLNTNTDSIIGGGRNNKLDNSDNASIIGGFNNNILTGDTSFIIGGNNNDIQARPGSNLSEAGILGGINNNIVDVSSDSDRSFIIGGVNNDINNAGDSIILSSGLSDITGPSTQYGFILGSSGSLVNSSFFSGLVGGFNNELNGVSRSVILGGQNITGTTDDTVYVPYLRVIDSVNIGTPNPSVDAGPPINIINNDALYSINAGSGNTLGGNYSMTLGNNLRAIGDGLLVGGTSTNTQIIYGGNSANYSISWGRNVEMYSDATDSLCNIAVGDYIYFEGGSGNAVFGSNNTIRNNESCVITGSKNRMENSNGLNPSISSSIIGGTGNTITKTSRGAIIGGDSNVISSFPGRPEDSVIIGGSGNTISHNRSVILGGKNISSTTNDTVYVPNLNINNVGGTTPITNLGIDSNGNVVSGSTEPDSMTFEIFNTSPTSPDPYTIYDDGNIRLLFDEAATDDIEIVVLTNPSTGPVHVVWSEPTAGTSGSANVTTASGQIPLNTEVSADDVVDFVIWAPEDATYPYYEAKVTVSNGTFTSIPAVARVSKWNTPS